MLSPPCQKSVDQVERVPAKTEKPVRQCYLGLTNDMSLSFKLPPPPRGGGGGGGSYPTGEDFAKKPLLDYGDKHYETYTRECS